MWPSSLLRTLSFASVCLLGAVGGEIYGAQFGSKPFVLTVLCPSNGQSCLFHIETVPTARVSSSRSKKGDVINYDLFWQTDQRILFVHALNFMNVFPEGVGVDGLGNIKFNAASGTASLELSLSAGLRARASLLSPEQAASLCGKFHCEG